MKPFFVSAIALLALVSTAQAGPWLENKDSATIYATAGRQYWDHVYDTNGTRQNSSAQTQYVLGVLAEYGLEENITLGVHPTFYSLSGYSQSISGISSVELLARGKVLQWDSGILSLQPLVVIPGGYQDSSGQITSGNKQLDTELRALLGNSFDIGNGRSAFVGLEAAYRKRFGIPNDEVRWDATAGIRPWPRWISFVQLFNTYPVGPNPDPNTNYTLNQLSLSIGRETIDRLTAVLTYNRQIAGKTALSGDGWFLGAWYHLY